MSIVSGYKLTYERTEPRIVKRDETAQERAAIASLKLGSRRKGR